MNKKKKKISFEEDYFQDYYKGAVGEFSPNDLEVSKRWFWGWLKKLNHYIPVEKGKKRSVLEIGCSIGAVTNILTSRGFEVYASDISKFAVKNAKKLTPKAVFFTQDIQKKVKVNKKFDIVLAFEVVEHLEDPKKGIKNMYDALKKGGTVVISSPYPYKWNFNDPTHINVKYPDEWVTLLQEVGFKQIKCHRFSLLPYFYRYSKHFHIIFPFPIPISFFVNPIFFIAKK